MKKIIGIFIVALLIATALPSLGMSNELKSTSVNKFYNYRDFEFVPGEFIVKFKESPISRVSIDNLNEKHQVYSTEKVFKNHEDTILDNIYSFYVSEDADISSIIEDYNSLPDVEYAEPNYIGYAFGVPNDEFFPIQWGLNNTGQIIIGDKTGTIGADISAVEAWDIETGSSDVVIAILDTGVDYTHPDLDANIWINEDEIPGNSIDDDGNGFVDDYYGYDSINLDGDPIDDCGHGTTCAGVAAGVGNNDIGISGVCGNCKIMAIKLLSDRGYGSYKSMADGIIYAADNGANVLSMSFGATSGANILKNAIDYAYEKGCVLVAAAGNLNVSTKSYPAGYDNVIAASAVNQNDGRCIDEDWDPDNIYIGIMGSNFGYWVDVAAPGNLVYSTMPSYPVTNNEILNTNTGQNFINNYDYRWGTSFATPHVAGLAVLLLSQDPTLANEEVRKIIRANVDPYISEEYMGTGRINAYKALTRYNTQPEIPETPTGEINGKTGRKYTFTTIASDPDDDRLYYVWDWGDGNYSDEIGPFNSGVICEASYTWSNDGNYSIIVKAVDGKGGESYWSDPLVVSMPKPKSITIFNPWIFRLIQHFPILEFLL